MKWAIYSCLVIYEYEKGLLVVESALNILIKELDLELRDPRMPGVEVSFMEHGTFTIELQISWYVTFQEMELNSTLLEWG